jgi:hypothetical protein
MKDPVEMRGISPLPHRLGAEISGTNKPATSPSNPNIKNFLFMWTPDYPPSSGRRFNTFSIHYLGARVLEN